jgi:hypothetical protein
MSLRMPHRLLLIAGAASAVSLSALALLPVTASAAAAPGRYTTIDVPGAASTVAVGINDSGVAGTGSSQGTSVGYINDFGQVTGSYTESSGNTIAFAGPAGTFPTVSDPAGPAFSTSTAGTNVAGISTSA